MNSDDFLELADNPDFISGIYNYCDDWCERCGFTDRCLQYARKRNRPVPVDDVGDLDGEALMKQLEEVFTSSIALLRSMAAEDGIDLDAIDTTDIDEARERLNALVDEHPLSLAASHHAKLAFDWMEAAGPDFQAKGEQWEAFVRMNVPGIDVVAQAIDLRDAVEVVQWYFIFIPIQVSIALRIQMDPQTYNTEPRFLHADGKAKIALIAMDRSLAAWTLLLHTMPRRETETLELLAQLARLRRDTENFFPNARAFVRPGLDL